MGKAVRVGLIIAAFAMFDGAPASAMTTTSLGCVANANNTRDPPAAPDISFTYTVTNPDLSHRPHRGRHTGSGVTVPIGARVDVFGTRDPAGLHHVGPVSFTLLHSLPPGHDASIGRPANAVGPCKAKATF